MRKSLLALTPLAIALVLPLGAQKRQKKAEKLDFPARIARGQQAFEKGQFGTCVAELREATAIAMQHWRKAMRAALPQPRAGWKLMPARNQDASQNAMAAMLMASTGALLDAEYRADEGKGRAKVQVIANSPMVRMVQGMFGMAQMNPKIEVVEYEHGDKALLEKQGAGRLKLSILIQGIHLLVLEVTGMTDDELFEFMSQKALDAIRKQL